MGCLIGGHSVSLRMLGRKLRGASRWHAVFVPIRAALAVMVGGATGQAVGPTAALRLGRVRFSRICSAAPKKNILVFTMGPPMVAPNCSRRKSLSGLPSDVLAVRACRRWK